jgi:hypothetical protein
VPSGSQTRTVAPAPATTSARPPRLRDRAHDRDAEAGAVARAAEVLAREALERAPGEPWGDAVALIGDLERQPGSGAAGSQHDLALAVAQGVVDQVAECLTQAQLVVVHDGG